MTFDSSSSGSTPSTTMSSSRRSIRSLRSPNPPAWSSKSVIKNSASSSLSYILAEPLQGRPLPPATSQLPAHAVPRPSQANVSKDPSEDTLLDEPASSGQALDDGQNPDSNEPAAQIISGAHAAPEFTKPNDSNVSTPLEPQTSSNSRGDSSWLSSFSRKGNTQSPTAATPSVNSPQPSNGSVPVRVSSPTAIIEPTIPIEQNEPVVDATINSKSPVPSTESESMNQSPLPAQRPTPPPRLSWFSSAKPTPPPADQATSPKPSPTPQLILVTATEPQLQVEPVFQVSPTEDQGQAPQVPPNTPISEPPPPNPEPQRPTPSQASRFSLGIPFFGMRKSQSPPEVKPKGAGQDEFSQPSVPPTAATKEGPSTPPRLDHGNAKEGIDSPVLVSPVPNPIPISDDIPSISNEGDGGGATWTATAPTGATTTDERTDTEPAIIPSSSSWWSYVGWSSALPSSSSIDKHSHESPRSKEDGQENDNPKEELPPPTVEGHQQTSAVDEAQAGMKVKAKSIDTSDPGRPNVILNEQETGAFPPNTMDSQPQSQPAAQPQRPPEGEGEIQLAEGSSSSTQPQGYAWYSPWAWYGPSSVSPAPAPSSGPSPAGEAGVLSRDTVGDGDDNVTNKTKDEVATSMGGDGSAGAAGQGSDLSPSSSPKPDTATEGTGSNDKKTSSTSKEGEGINPVGLTIQTHKSAWAYFFSSKAALTKAIKAKGEEGNGGVRRDENGMEVMDLGDEEGGAGVVDVQVAPPSPTSTRLMIEAPPNTPISAGRSSSPTPSVQNKFAPASPEKIPTRELTTRRPGESSLSTTPTENGRMDRWMMQGKKPPTGTGAGKRTSSTSPAPSVKRRSRPGSPSSIPKSVVMPIPNLVLPSWEDVFHTAPRNTIPPTPPSRLAKTIGFVSDMLFSKEAPAPPSSTSAFSVHSPSSPQSPTAPTTPSLSTSPMSKMGEMWTSTLGARATNWVKGKPKEDVQTKFINFGNELPRAWEFVPPSGTAAKAKSKAKAGGTGVGVDVYEDVLRGCEKVVVIGIHGWFPGAVMRTVIGEPTGTSSKFVNMMVQALEEFQQKHGVKLKKVTRIPLEGEGTIIKRVEKLYSSLLANEEWMRDIYAADAILVATHSQGSIVSTHLLDRLIRDGFIVTLTSHHGGRGPGGFEAMPVEPLVPGGVSSPGTSPAAISPRKPQKVCCLALCGIHLGPLRYLRSSTLVQPYIQYFESAAARELFEFQNTESAVSKEYVEALTNVFDHGIKMVYVASLNDQVVPLYSGLFTAARHPLILRALYIDGDAYHSSDFLSNLLVLLLRMLNSGLSDSGLITLLSEATAGSLNGVGHSTAYEELATYSLAVNYLFLTDDGLRHHHPGLSVEHFDALSERNDYEIPWVLRDLIADERISYFFSPEIAELRDAFRDWHPKTSILRDVKRKLSPIQRLSGSAGSNGSMSALTSKL